MGSNPPGRAGETVLGPPIVVTVSPDHLEAYLQADPRQPEGLSRERAMALLKESRVVFGVEEKAVELALNEYQGKKVLVARGRPVEHGRDGEIVYHFIDSSKGRPEVREDGTVDFYSLHLVKNVKKGDLLATRIPPTMGEMGMNVFGGVLKPRPGKNPLLRPGKNTQLDETGNQLFAAADGHVTVSPEGLISVSPVYEVSGDVDFSTGNIDFVGNVVVTGSIRNGFIVKADGSVEVFGALEGSVFAGQDVTVRGGIMGKGKGTVIAGGTVNARFIENGSVQAGENVQVSEAILNSSISAGKKVIVEGRRGAIVGGVVRAGEEVRAKVIGSNLAPPTQVEVGIRPGVRQAYKEICAEIAGEEKTLEKSRQMLQILEHLERTRGELPPENKELQEKLRLTETRLLQGIEERRLRRQELEAELNSLRYSRIKVSGTIYPGVSVIIGNSSLNLNDQVERCYLTGEGGEIKIFPLN